jgi:protein subunit release factor B
MRFPHDVPVTAKKLDALRARLERLEIDLAKITEASIKGSGPGGQKINKTSIGVRLHYALTADDTVIVKWSRERSRGLNRFLALRELVDQVEIRVDPAASKRLQDAEKKRKQKARRKRRSQSSADTPPDPTSDSESASGSGERATSPPRP